MRIVVKRHRSPDEGDGLGSAGLRWWGPFVSWRWTRRAGLAGASGSFLLHVVLLLVLSFLILEQFRDSKPLSTEWSHSEDGPVSLPESVAATLQVESSAAAETETPRIDTALLEGREHVLEDALSESILEQMSALDSQVKSSGGGLLQAPAGARVVRKGSFSVWTVPTDPRPGQEYRIVIQVRLPKSVRRYRAMDLSGDVLGTDDYRQQIPWDPRWVRRTDVALTMRNGRLVPLRRGDFLAIRDRLTQLVIRVPPARRLVRDRITIRSRLLKEQQVLEIVF